MPRLMKCRFSKKKNKKMQRDGYFSKKRCPCGRKKNKLNPDEKLSQTEFLMKYASKGKCCFFLNVNWNIIHDLDPKKYFFFRFTVYFIWCDKMIVLWINIYFFTDFSPKFIRTKRSYLQLVGNTSSSSQNSISSLPGMKKKNKDTCI